MTLPLTPGTLATAYDYLCEFPPFNKWGMPASSEVKFSINRKTDRYAHYHRVNGVHKIAVSARFVGRHELLLSTLSHEMIHLYMAVKGMPASHGQAFQTFADRICKVHQFDRLNF